MSETAAPISVAIAGVAGRMGRQLVKASREAGFDIFGGTEAPNSPALMEDIGVLGGGSSLKLLPVTDPAKAAKGADLWIDFTPPAALRSSLAALSGTGVKAVVIGTTGLSDEDEVAIRTASSEFAVVKSGNYSVGVNLLEALTRIAAARLGAADWDIEVLETHHRRKVDAPSGTALMLGEAAAEGRGASLNALRLAPYDGTDAKRVEGGIGFSVRRSGGVVGEHEVTFGSDQEVISLSHRALDRSVFAFGAVAAGRWAVGRPPGLYNMDDVLGLRDI